MSAKFVASLLYAAVFLQNTVVFATEWHPAFVELHRRADNITTASGNSTNATKAVNSTKPANSTSSSAKKGPSKETIEGWRLAWCLAYLWTALAGSLLLYIAVLSFRKYLRLISCLGNDNQRYFSSPNRYYGLIKKHLIDAPLFRTRHHREFQLSPVLNCGTLPSRAQTMFLIGYLATVIILTVYHVDFSEKRSKVLTHLTKRTGLMAIWNMLPLFLLAGRNNILLYWTGISFDTYNLIHRWLGRIVIVEGVAHMAVYLIRKVEAGGWEAYSKALSNSRFILTGSIGAFALIAILIQSPSVIRHAFYETFLHVHQVLAIVVLAAVYAHMDGYAKQRGVLYWIFAIWAIERGFRLLRLLYRNIGEGGTRAEVTALEGDVVRLKVRLARPWQFSPGQHAYVYVPFVGLWTSHPFSVAWSDEDEEELISDKESLPKTQQDTLHERHSNIYFLIKKQTGFTHKLWLKARKSPTGHFTTRVFVEGPYNSQRLDSYGTVILFAAGIGITHQVPHVRELVKGYANGSVATRRVVLVWTIRTEKSLEWIREWMTQILILPRRREVLKILLFITRPEKSSHEIYSPSSSVQLIPGRPNFQAIIDQEIELSIGAVGVTVCGTGAVADQIRKACRAWMGKVEIDFEEESFSW